MASFKGPAYISMSGKTYHTQRQGAFTNWVIGQPNYRLKEGDKLNALVSKVRLQYACISATSITAVFQSCPYFATACRCEPFLPGYTLEHARYSPLLLGSLLPLMSLKQNSTTTIGDISLSSYPCASLFPYKQAHLLSSAPEPRSWSNSWMTCMAKLATPIDL